MRLGGRSCGVGRAEVGTDGAAGTVQIADWLLSGEPNGMRDGRSLALRMRVLGRRLALLVGLSLCAAQAQKVMAQGADEAKLGATTVLVFDGSGSMWGKLEGEKPTKLVQARDAVRAALGKVAPTGSSIGLMSFGHRRSADCSDIQLISAPEPAVAPAIVDRIMTPLEKLNPKGKGPLTSALKEAAKVLGKTAGPRSIVLIHDDPDNCQQDACAALAEMQQAAPGVVVHVVGLGLKPDEAQRYQCLTKPTGGRHVDAQDGPQIAAAIGDVLAVALQGMRDSAQPKVPAKSVTQEQVAIPVALSEKPQPIILAVDGPPALRLRALMAKDVAMAGHPVRWLVWPSTAPEDATPIGIADGAEAKLALATGDYRVRADGGLVRRDILATVAAKGETLAEVTFDAGEIRLKTPLAADAIVIVGRRAVSADPASPPTPIGILPHSRAEVLVPAGVLVLSLEQAELKAERAVDIAAGQARELDMTQPGGRVLLDLMPTVGPATAALIGADAAVTVFALTEDDPDAPNGRRELARSAARRAEFVVAPGSYMVTATRGVFETRERVTVVAGEAVSRSLPLVASRLVIAARLGSLGEAGEVAANADTFRLSRLDAPAGPPLLLSGPVAIVDVPPGKYRIDARRNTAAISVQQDVEIKAGEYKAVTLDYQAGALRMDAVLKGDLDARGVVWLIVDEGGRLIWSSYELAPTAVLGPGRYTVRMAVRGSRYEVPVTIRAGDITTVRLGQP
jgi:Ca-activated chloride channel homolog